MEGRFARRGGKWTGFMVGCRGEGYPLDGKWEGCLGGWGEVMGLTRVKFEVETGCLESAASRRVIQVYGL